MTTKLKNFFFGECTGACHEIVYTVFRVIIGLSMAFLHGHSKLPPNEQMVSGVAGLGFPMPGMFAWGAGLTEFLGSLFIALGFCTRPAAIALGIVMLVAFGGAHKFALTGPGSGELAFLYLLAASLIASRGSGKWGVDRFLRERLKCC